MPVEFLYRREDPEEGVQTTTFLYPDDPYIHPHPGARFQDPTGRMWTCLGKVQDQPKEEPA